MIITTSGNIEGKEILDYKGLVFGEVVAGVNIFKDITAWARDIFGGRSKTYEGELITARQEAIEEMEQRAMALGANAIIGVKVDYESFGQTEMLMVIATGTAVYCK